MADIPSASADQPADDQALAAAAIIHSMNNMHSNNHQQAGDPAAQLQISPNAVDHMNASPTNDIHQRDTQHEQHKRHHQFLQEQQLAVQQLVPVKQEAHGQQAADLSTPRSYRSKQSASHDHERDHDGKRISTGGTDVDMAVTEDDMDGSRQDKQPREEFAFRPTRPRTKGVQRPRASSMGGTSSQGNERERDRDHGTTPHAPGLDSLALAAAHELGDDLNEGSAGAPDHMSAPGGAVSRPASSMQRDSEAQGGYGEYGYDDGEEGEHEYEEGEGDEETEDMSPYNHGGSSHGGAANQAQGGTGRGGSGSRRPCPRRGGAPRPRDPSAETGAEESGILYAATSGRPELDLCPPDMFEADLVGFLTARGERQLAAHVREKRITCNSLPLDIYGLYKEVVKRGGYIANERYDDKGSRWTGTINFAGDIFPRLKNWTANNRATSVGSQLLNNYRKFLLAYERAYARWDLPNTDLAAHQRNAAATATNGNPAAEAAAIVAAAIAAGNRRGQWDASADSTVAQVTPSLTPAAPAPTAPSTRRSSAGGATAGTKRSNQSAADPSNNPNWSGVPAANAPGHAPSTPAAMNLAAHDHLVVNEEEVANLQLGSGFPAAAFPASSPAWMGGLGAAPDHLGNPDPTTHLSKRRKHTQSDPGIATGTVLKLSPSPSSNMLPGVRRVQALQQHWAGAQLNLVMTGMQCPMPNQLLLAQDPIHPAMHWAVLVVDLGELPITVADGAKLPPASIQSSRLPLALHEASPSNRLEEATPVLLLGTNALGWVPRMTCRPPHPSAIESAMASVWARIQSGSPGGALEVELACVRGLKQAIELLNILQNAPGSSGGAGGTPSTAMQSSSMNNMAGTARQLIQAAAIHHSSNKLLELEGTLCHQCLTTTAMSYWTSWRDSVKRAETAAALSSCVLSLIHQIQPTYFVTQMDMLWPELLALLGLTPPFSAQMSGTTPLLVSGMAGEPSVLGVDMAIALVQASIDWQGMRRMWASMTSGIPSSYPFGTTTPMGTVGISTPGSWPFMPAPTPQAVPGSTTPFDPHMPINLVERPTGQVIPHRVSTPGADAGHHRKPLPPVGPTATPSNAPAGAGFSSRASQAGTGLPPRPPPVRVGSMPGNHSTGGHAASPTAQQQHNTNATGLSPLRLVPGMSGQSMNVHGYGNMQTPTMDLNQPGAIQMGSSHMGNMQQPQQGSNNGGRSSSDGHKASHTRAQSPPPTTQNSLDPTAHGLVPSTHQGNIMLVSAASSVQGQNTNLASPNMQPGSVVFGSQQPMQQQQQQGQTAVPSPVMGAINAVPLDLSAPSNMPSSGGAMPQYGSSGGGANAGFGAPMQRLNLSTVQMGNSATNGATLLSPTVQLNLQQPRLQMQAIGGPSDPASTVMLKTGSMTSPSGNGSATALLTTPAAMPGQTLNLAASMDTNNPSVGGGNSDTQNSAMLQGNNGNISNQQQQAPTSAQKQQNQMQVQMTTQQPQQWLNLAGGNVNTPSLMPQNTPQHAEGINLAAPQQQQPYMPQAQQQHMLMVPPAQQVLQLGPPMQLDQAMNNNMAPVQMQMQAPPQNQQQPQQQLNATAS